MRVLPLALSHKGSDAELARDAARQSIVTHAHPRSRLCCALYCLFARATLEGHTDAWSRAAIGFGLWVDCLHSARAALEETTFEHAIRAGRA